MIAVVLAAGAAPASPTVPVPPSDAAMTMGDCMTGRGPLHGQMKGRGTGMRGGCVPPGVTPATVPEPESPGAKLLVRFCAQCHHLPSPAMHSADEWPAVAARMIDRMEQYRISRRGMGRSLIQMPTAEARQAILAYLQRHALTPARPDALGPADAPGLSLFKTACSQCHALPEPRLHTSAEWPGIVERMRTNMKRMGKPVITDRERDAIVGYLSRPAR